MQKHEHPAAYVPEYAQTGRHLQDGHKKQTEKVRLEPRIFNKSVWNPRILR